jgi:hypothetical protein
MAYSLTDLRGQLRAALDEATPSLWPDAALDVALAAAVAAHSHLFPQRVAAAIDVVDGQQDYPVYPLLDPASGVQRTPPAGVDLIRVEAAELPPGAPLPEDAPGATPARPRAGRADQGYTMIGGTLRLRRLPAGGEIGAGLLRVILRQTYNWPDDSGVTWNGPAHDLPLVLLLAKRAAYQFVAERQVAAQGTAAATGASGAIDLHIAVPAILASLEVEIARAIAARQAA